jgi:probable HAF family extracellular repeat protein
VDFQKIADRRSTLPRFAGKGVTQHKIVKSAAEYAAKKSMCRTVFFDGEIRMPSPIWKRFSLAIGFAVFASGSAPSYALPPYSITDLGTLGGGQSNAVDINNLGQVVGSSRIPGYPLTHAFLYSNGTMTDLGSLGAGSSGAAGINDTGQIVGGTSVGNGPNGPQHGFLYSNGVMRDIGTLGGTGSGANAINNAGQIVGSSTTAGEATTHPFLYSGGIMTDLGTLGGTTAGAARINNAGQITGTSDLTGSATTHAFLYSDGILKDIGTLNPENSAVFSRGNGINDHGQVVGFSSPTTQFGGHAFLYSDGVMSDIGNLGVSNGESGPLSFAEATDINNAGQIVGISLPINGNNTHPFLYSDGVMTDLSTLPAVQSAGWLFLNDAAAINEKGQIVGRGYLRSNGEEHAYLLTPLAEVPEPSVALLMLAGVLGIGGAGFLRKSRAAAPDASAGLALT